MKKNYLSILLLLGLFPLRIFGGSLPSDWKNIQEIQFEKSGLSKVSLPLEVLDSARPDLADLRVMDGSGREVPWLIERPVQGKKQLFYAARMETTVQEQETLLTVQTGVHQPLEAIWVETPAHDFLKSVSIEGSHDGKNWKSIVEGQPIFRQTDGAANLKITIPPAEWTALRLKLDDHRSPPIPLTGVQIQTASGEPAPAEPLDITLVDRVESSGQTRLILRAAGANVTLADLTFETSDSLFARQVTLLTRQYSDNESREVPISRGIIYRVSAEGSPVSSHLAFAEDVTLPSREMIVTIQNGDSPPLNISAVRAHRRPVYAILSPPVAGLFYFLIGNRWCDSPHYDLAGLESNLRNTPLIKIPMGSLKPNPDWQPREKMASEIPELGSPIDVQGWAFRKRVQVSQAGVQQLELDPETLSKIPESPGSLRLVSKGQQVPYILEHTGLLRVLKIHSEGMKTDSKHRSVSCWELQLPFSKLPIEKLNCASTTPIFRRDIHVFEEIPDDRGVIYRRELGSATWVQTPSQKNGTYSISLNSPLQTNKMILEMDNGDNPPVDFRDFEAWYPATKLLFKANPGRELSLYYNNPRVGSPHYDIDLVADQLLFAEKATATLSPEERFSKSNWDESPKAKAVAGPLFWAALVMMVLALVFVMAKLLPKTPSTEEKP